MAHKKGQGSSRNGRDSHAQRLGVKRGDGELVSTGTIIVRQRGTPWQAGSGARRAGDDSIFAAVDGRVRFRSRGRLGRFIEIHPVS
jgi:large subunit ribosomal protein L27